MGKLYNLARMTTATVGTGTITLGAAVSGYLSFANAGVANADVVDYGIKDGANSEAGTGTYTSAGTTLTRTVTKSTNANAAISLSGTAEVFISPRAETLPNLGTTNNFTDTTEATGAGTTASAIFRGGVEILKKLYVSGVALFSTGSAANPSVAGSISTNSGMFFPVAGQAAISGNGLEVLRWSNTGLGRASAFQAVWSLVTNALCFVTNVTTGINTAIDFSNSALTQCGAINVNSGTATTTFLTSSDERGKPYRTRLSGEAARAVVDGLEIYDYDDPRNLIQGVGPLAQQAYYILPRMVAEGDSEQALNLDSPTCQMWLTDLSKAVPYLIANLQEANRRIASLEEQVSQLRA